jgi:hypothetical protein
MMNYDESYESMKHHFICDVSHVPSTLNHHCSYFSNSDARILPGRYLLFPFDAAELSDAQLCCANPEGSGGPWRMLDTLLQMCLDGTSPKNGGL